MGQPSIREVINAALDQEQETRLLRTKIEQQLPQLQSSLILPEQAPVDALMAFITRYIQSVPTSLRLVTAVSKRLGFFSYAAPFLHLAEDYFLQPPDPVAQTEGLEALLDEAFLAHRLLEEVNDHHIRFLQRPLLPVDMTEANIIVHHLLGDALASRLEELVQFTAEGLLEKEHVWAQVLDQPGAAESQDELVSSIALTEPDTGIRLRLAS